MAKLRILGDHDIVAARILSGPPESIIKPARHRFDLVIWDLHSHSGRCSIPVSEPMDAGHRRGICTGYSDLPVQAPFSNLGVSVEGVSATVKSSKVKQTAGTTPRLA